MSADHWNSHSGPGGLVWTLALAGVVLPWIGVPAALAGVVLALRGHPSGWSLAAAGAAMLVVDLLIDLAAHRWAATQSEEPHLNVRAATLVGTRVTVVEPLVAGRGKVGIGDTVWLAEGPDCPAGRVYIVIGATGSVLQVAPPPTEASPGPDSQATPARSRS